MNYEFVEDGIMKHILLFAQRIKIVPEPHKRSFTIQGKSQVWLAEALEKSPYKHSSLNYMVLCLYLYVFLTCDSTLNVVLWKDNLLHSMGLPFSLIPLWELISHKSAKS